jgi:acetylornithine deacetylase/succinyl-diaminopimelate desuccinylase-like protein
MAVMELEAFIMIKKAGTPLKRDIILAFTGDEESGGEGIQVQLAKRFDSVDAVSVLNEGGGLILGDDGKVKHVSLNLAEKIYQDFLLVTEGPTGHSSVPLAGNAIDRLAAAVEKASKFKHPAHLIDVTRAYFAARSEIEKDPRFARAFKALAKSKGKLPADALAVVESNPVEAANLRTTCTATLISGGTRANALPSEASANINCRILPDESVEIVKERLTQVVGDKEVEIKIADDFKNAQPSSLEGEVPLAVKRVAQEMFPGVKVIPFMFRGATDSRFLRAKGVNCGVPTFNRNRRA